MSNDDFGLFDREEQVEEKGSLRSLNAPKPLTSEQLEAKYHGVSFDTIHSDPVVFEDYESPNADGSPRIEILLGTGKIGDKDNPAEVKILKE